MSLRERVLVILFVMFGGYITLEYAIHRWRVYPDYVRQEQQQAQIDIERITEAIERDAQAFEQAVAEAARAGQWSQALNRHSLPAAATLPPVDFILAMDHRWQRRWASPADSETADLLEQQLLKTDTPFIRADRMGFSQRGLYAVNGRYAWVVAEPILAAPQSRTVEGMVLAGRYVTDAAFDRIKKQWGFNFTWQILSPDKLTVAAADAAAAMTGKETCHFASLGDNLLQCTTLLLDSRRQPAVLIKTYQDRVISAQGRQVLYQLMLIKLAVGFAGVLFLTILSQRFIITPLVKLVRHIENAETLDRPVSPRVLSRKDEIGALARAFDRLCDRVRSAQAKLVEKSYFSGVTEMSAGILHNVRNALSPITTRIERIKGQFRQLPLEHLQQARQELETGALSPERRTDLMRFVELTFQTVVDNLNETVDGLGELSGQVSQIEAMLNTQKTAGAADRTAAAQSVTPLELVDKALDLVPEQHRKRCRVDRAQLKAVPPVAVHVATFTQVLQNLIINAAESLQRRPTLCPKITVTCRLDPDATGSVLHWQVQDNGAGIAPENLKHIFERGASSKKTGLTGIGLHWCANTITAMRGKIWAESDGPDRGACLHLVVPMAASETPAAEPTAEALPAAAAAQEG